MAKTNGARRAVIKALGGYGWCQSCGALVFKSPKCHKCGGAVKAFCLDMELVKLQAENKTQAELIEELEAKNDKYNGALVRIDIWAKAYPHDIFLKPDLKRAAKILKAAGMTLDAISADAMRHVLDGVKDIVKQALEGGE